MMPELKSNYFDGIAYNTDSLFLFKSGIPAFESERSFAGVEIPDQRPLLYLQSLRSADLCLMTLPVRSCCPDYNLAMTPEDLELLDLPANSSPRIGEGIACLAIVTVDETGEPAVNLAAPIVINLANRFAVQAIHPDRSYSHRHLIAPKLADAVSSCS